MINRALLRIKAVQVLYAEQINRQTNVKVAEKDLKTSIGKAYDLYIYFLQLIVELTRYAEYRIDAAKHKLLPSSEDLNPNTKFIDNSFVRQLSENETLNQYVTKNQCTWDEHRNFLKKLLSEIYETAFYKEYMESESCDYEADKNVWRKIVKNIFQNDEELYSELEEMSIYWLDDIEIVSSFVVKTIKQFQEGNGASQSILPMYSNSDDEEFIMELLDLVLENDGEYSKMIDKYTQNWDIDRIALMDTIIMKMAIAELLHFPTIPVKVTLNEYIELAKNYSTNRSGNFVNGILDKLVTDLKKNHQLQKVGEVGK